MIFKINNNLVEFSKNKLIQSPTLRRQFNFQVPHSKLELHKNFFFPSSISLWNNLTDELKNQSYLNTSKNLLNKTYVLD